MNPTTDEALAAARLWAVHNQPYLAAALFALTAVERPGLGTFGVDARWRLYVDPLCLEQWSTAEAGAVLVHEANHLLRDHARRAADVGVGPGERRRFNAAGDLEINDDLSDLPLPSGGLQPSTYRLPTGELAETYFAALSVVGDGPPGWWCGGGSGAHGVAESWEDPSAAEGVRPGEGDLIRQQVAMELRRVVNAGGHIADGLARWAEAFLHPRVDWRRHLAGVMRGGLGISAGAADYSYARPSRRIGTPIGQQVVFPRLIQHLPRVAVVVDTSASMDQQLLERLLAEVRGILRIAGISGAATTVLSCDTAVRATQSVFSARELQLQGGGGTSLGVGLRAVADLRPRCDVAVVLTDGFTAWPPDAPGRFHTIIGIIGTRRGNEPSWADIVEIPA